MKTLELKQMAFIEGGKEDDCAFHAGVSTTLMVVGIATAFTGAGAIFLLGGAVWGFVNAETNC